jgi:hypothetical protein
MIQPILYTPCISFSLCFNFKKALHFSILKFAVIDGRWHKEDLNAITVHHMISELSEVKRMVEEVEKTLLLFRSTRTEVNAVMVLINFWLRQAVVQHFQ